LTNCTFPTLNQNTTGSAATLTTARTIGGTSFNGSANITVATATGGFTVSGGNLALGANSITSTGSLSSTGARLAKLWATDGEFTNSITIGGTSIASIYAPIANPTLTGTPLAPTATLGTNTTQIATTAFVIANSTGIWGSLTGTLSDQDDLWEYLTDTVSIQSVVPMLNDTIPLVTFGIGSGATADTACFNDDRLAGAFYNEGSDTLVVTQLMGIITEGTGTETISVQISWHATFKSGSATSLNAAALAITSMTTGTADVSFTNSKIPPNVFVWCTLSGASKDNKPTFLSVTLSGYKIPTY
jgi:hypothetical protein